MTILLLLHRIIFPPFSVYGEAGPIIETLILLKTKGVLPSDPAAVTFFLASEFTRITELTFLMGPSHRQDLRNNTHVVAGIHSLNNIKEKQGNSQTLFH